MREKSGRARKREDESPSVGGGRKSAAEERRGGGGVAEEGYTAERWWIEEGRGRMGSGVEGLPGGRGWRVPSGEPEEGRG